MTKQKIRKRKVKKFPKKIKKPVKVDFYEKPKAKQPATEPKPAAAPPKITPHPTAGRKVSEFEDRLDEALAEAPPKRGRGRPRKPSEPAEPEPQEIGLDVVKPVVKIPFDLWSARQGLDKLKITEQEAAQIAEPLKVLLDHYLPQIPTIAYAWISLAVVSYTVFQPRLELIQQIKKQSSPVSAKPDAVGKKGQGHPGQGSPPAAPVSVIKNYPGQQDFPTEIKTEKV